MTLNPIWFDTMLLLRREDDIALAWPLHTKNAQNVRKFTFAMVSETRTKNQDD